VYGFVHPASGKTQWLMMPEVSTEAMALALAAFARAEGVSARKQILLVVDGAPWHTTPR